MTDLRPLLEQHIRDVEGVAPVWGEDDCTLWPARWVEKAKGVALRLPAYGNLDEAGALAAEAGSLAALWDRHVADILPPRYGEPQLGDVGVVIAVSAPLGQAGGIFGLDGTFFWRSVRGVGLLRPRASTIIKVWAVS